MSSPPRIEITMATSSSHPLPASHSERIRLHATPTSVSAAARKSIIESSAKGWSPLQINKREGITSPHKASPSASPIPPSTPPLNGLSSATSPRRTSNSFKHVTTNSLVSNSPFKSPTTVQGQQAAGLYVEPTKADTVIHERRSTRSIGATPEKAVGAASTPKAAIGLGIIASRPSSRPRSSSRTPSGSISKSRRVSSERRSPSPIPPVPTSERPSEEREQLEAKENNSPDARSGKKGPRNSTGLGKLAKNEYVSKSPFLATARRIPSGERPIDGYSPKTIIPIEKDDVFGSPSPRRTSGSRQRSSISPAKAVGSSIRGESSPSPSSRGLTTSFSAAGPSPLSRPSNLPSLSDRAGSTPTPTRSSMTPSRRLRGPRDLSDGIDSPSKQPKTVTFHAIPDVKEFEPVSHEASADGSFESASEEGDGSLDSIVLDESLHSLSNLHITNRDNSRSPSPAADEGNDFALGDESTTADFVDALIQEGLLSPPQSQCATFDDDGSLAAAIAGDTAAGSAPALSTPSLGDSVHATPLLESILPSGSKIQCSDKEVDSACIPYGRTHHAERAAIAHSAPLSARPVKQPDLPHQSDHQLLFNANAAQPSLYSDPFDTAPISPTRQFAHQLGPMPDPFITIQTATSVLSPPKATQQRAEDGVPLGRTSHLERMQAARILASQSIGLGMPRSPAVRKDLGTSTAEMGLPTPAKPANKDLPKSNSEDLESLFDVSFESARRESMSLPTAPLDGKGKAKEVVAEPTKSETSKPTTMDKPAPVKEASKPVEQVKTEELKVAEKKEKAGFSLPSIGFTSPFFSQMSRMPSDGSISGSSINSTEETDQENRPLTPPPIIPAESSKKPESPHRIPSFEFEEITLGMAEPVALTTTAVTPVKATVVTPIKSSQVTGKVSSPFGRNPVPSASRPVSMPPSSLPRSASGSKLQAEDPLPPSKAPTAPVMSPTKAGTPIKAGPSPISIKTSAPLTEPSKLAIQTKDGLSSTSPSAGPRIRQRISREMVRETINQRLADGSLSRRSSTQALVGVSAHYADLAPTPPRPASMMSPIRPSGGESALVPINLDKVLPPPPPGSQSKPMSPIRTSNKGPRKVSSVTFDLPEEGRPSMKPRTQTQSAHEVLKASEKDGVITEPKSALDRIIGRKSSRSDLNQSTSSSSTAILKPVSPAPPPKTVSFPVAHVQSRRAEPVETGNDRTPTKDRNRAVSGARMASAGSRRSRRSMSMSDAPEPLKVNRKKRDDRRLTLGIHEDDVSILEQFREEAANIGKDRNYRVRERPVVKASYGPIGHGVSGDVHGGKAWRSLRKPSDINEHATLLREIRTREATNGKASGTIFVKVLGIESVDMPIPAEPTFFCVTLDNGIDYIRTPYVRLGQAARVEQEFSLVEQRDFEFSLSLDIRNDPHILKAIHEKRNPSQQAQAAPSQPAQTSQAIQKASSGFRGLFGSPRKLRRPESMIQPRSATPQSILIKPSANPSPGPSVRPSIVDYIDLSPSSSGSARKALTVAKTHVTFRPIAKQCEGKVLEIRYPMFAMFKGGVPGQARSGSTEEKRRPVAKITLQIFRLAPLPGLQQDQLPSCLDEALRGIRHHAWWDCEYHEGILTQLGGDCANPKRRVFKVIGGSLVAINEITKKQVASIDLRKAIAVTDLNADSDDVPLSQTQSNQTPRGKRSGSPVSRMTLRRDEDELVEIRPRSFRLDFDDESGYIDFWADKQEDKDVWLSTLRGLIGRIPSNPLWAEVLARQQREDEEKRRLRKTTSTQSLKNKAEE